jgi:hypothetical protein
MDNYTKTNLEAGLPLQSMQKPSPLASGLLDSALIFRRFLMIRK